MHTYLRFADYVLKVQYFPDKLLINGSHSCLGLCLNKGGKPLIIICNYTNLSKLYNINYTNKSKFRITKTYTFNTKYACKIYFLKWYVHVMLLFKYIRFANVHIFDPQILYRLQIASGGGSIVMDDGRCPVPVRRWYR